VSAIPRSSSGARQVLSQEVGRAGGKGALREPEGHVGLQNRILIF
jgi:hypothetical protein